MAGYTEVLQTMFAMVLISLLVLNANRTIFVNNATIVEGELEDQIIAIAQDYIDESRSTTFDNATVNGGVPVAIPDGFTSIGPETGETSRSNFDDFDDYDGWTETITASGGVEYDVEIDVSYYNPDTEQNTSSKTTMKQMTITLSSVSLSNQSGTTKQYSFKFLRSFYAD